MENHLRLRDLLLLVCAPLTVLLCCSCGEIITPPEDSEALLPENVVQSILGTTTETVVTTTVTLNPVWQERAIGNYNGNNGIVIEGVPHYTQFTKYLTACESLASVSELHGASPWEFFIGDPRDAGGFGCYNTAIVKAINKFADGLAIPLDGLSIDDLCSDYIDKGQPVIFWGSIHMQRPYVSEFQWILPNGELYQFINPEHALVLIGYDDEWYYFCDSMSEKDVTPYNKQAVETAYEALGEQAVVIDPLILEALPQRMRVPVTNADEDGEEVEIAAAE